MKLLLSYIFLWPRASFVLDSSELPATGKSFYSFNCDTTIRWKRHLFLSDEREALLISQGFILIKDQHLHQGSSDNTARAHGDMPVSTHMLTWTWSAELGTDFRAWEFQAHCWFSFKEAKEFHYKPENYSGMGWGGWQGGGDVFNPKLESEGLQRRFVPVSL